VKRFGVPGAEKEMLDRMGWDALFSDVVFCYIYCLNLALLKNNR